MVDPRVDRELVMVPPLATRDIVHINMPGSERERKLSRDIILAVC